MSIPEQTPDPLAQIDSALADLDTAVNKEDRPSALAALAVAVGGLNALQGDSDPMPAFGLPSYTPAPGTVAYVSMPELRPWKWGDKDWTDKLLERLEKLHKGIDKLVQKFKPDQVQIAAGFPNFITVTLLWNTP